MKRIGLILVMIVIVSMKVSAQTNDTLKFSADKKQISTFLNLMHLAGLDSLYSGKPVTIFAPDNEAFNKITGWMPDSMLKPAYKQRLINILKGHIIEGKITAKELGQLIHGNLLIQQKTVLNTLYKSKLIAGINANHNITLTDENDGESIISQFDIPHFNATFFIIKNVLFSKIYLL